MGGGGLFPGGGFGWALGRTQAFLVAGSFTGAGDQAAALGILTSQRCQDGPLVVTERFQAGVLRKQGREGRLQRARLGLESRE